MEIIHSPDEMQAFSLKVKKDGKLIGLVPTMGALHKGHASLLKAIQGRCDLSVVSIFVNTTQFGENEDLDNYPRTFEMDCEKAEKCGCDVIFAPKESDIYPENYMTYVNVEGITQKLEGALRPKHFRGVTTIVLKLFNITLPHIAVFGQKDAQQAIVLRRMVKDLNFPVELLVCPTVRENDGLAVSSRNMYLNMEERNAVPVIYRGLCKAEDAYKHGENSAEKLVEIINNEYMQVDLINTDYIAVVDIDTLDPLEKVLNRALVAVACRTKITGTRLIDNIILEKL